MKATNRQLKILNFFGIRYSPKISAGAAGWEIADIFANDDKRERWRKYLYLTKDFDSDSPALKDFSEADLAAVEIPEDWSSSEQIQKFREEIVAQEMANQSPFDDPAPEVEFDGKSFMFTGKFSFGTRKDCQNAVLERGGIAPSQKSVSREIDYLVIGSGGSKSWKRSSYGNKIESAILARREHGAPAIISEEHWSLQLTKG